MTRWLLIILLVGIFTWCCWSDNRIETADQRWLRASQRMIEKTHDPLVSTTDINRVMILIQWATTNGYSVEVSHDGKDAGYKPEMYFTVVKKL